MADKTYSKVSGRGNYKITIEVTKSNFGDNAKHYVASITFLVLPTVFDICTDPFVFTIPDKEFRPNTTIYTYAGEIPTGGNFSCSGRNHEWVKITAGGVVRVYGESSDDRTLVEGAVEWDAPTPTFNTMPYWYKEGSAQVIKTESHKMMVGSTIAQQLDVLFLANGSKMYDMSIMQPTMFFPFSITDVDLRPNVPTSLVEQQPGQDRWYITIEANGYVHKVDSADVRVPLTNTDSVFYYYYLYDVDQSDFDDYTSTSYTEVRDFFTIDEKNTKVFHSPKTTTAYLRGKNLVDYEFINETLRENDIVFKSTLTSGSHYTIEFFETLINDPGTDSYELKKLMEFGYLASPSVPSPAGFFIYGTLKARGELVQSLEITTLYTGFSSCLSALNSLDNIAECAVPTYFDPERAGRPFDIDTWDKYPKLPPKEDTTPTVPITALVANFNGYEYYNVSKTLNDVDNMYTIDSYLTGVDPLESDWGRGYSHSPQYYNSGSSVQMDIPVRGWGTVKGPSALSIAVEFPAGTLMEKSWENLTKEFTYKKTAKYPDIQIWNGRAAPPSAGVEAWIDPNTVSLHKTRYLDISHAKFQEFRTKITNGDAYIIFNFQQGGHGERPYYLPTRIDIAPSTHAKIYSGREEGPFNDLRGAMQVYRIQGDYRRISIDTASEVAMPYAGHIMYKYRISSMDIQQRQNNSRLDIGTMINGQTNFNWFNHGSQIILRLRYSMDGIPSSNDLWNLGITHVKFRMDTDSTAIRRVTAVVLIFIVLVLLVLACVYTVGGFCAAGSIVAEQLVGAILISLWVTGTGYFAYDMVDRAVDDGVPRLSVTSGTKLMTAGPYLSSSYPPDYI